MVKHQVLLEEKVVAELEKAMAMQVEDNQVQQTSVVEAVEHFHTQETMAVVQVVRV